MIEAIFNIPVLFFVFGVIAVYLHSNLEIPKGMTDGIVLYLMLAIGIKGGISLAKEPFTLTAMSPTLIVVVGSMLVASYVFWICKQFLDRDTAACVGATYGSNSTMTYITAASFLAVSGIPYGGYMIIALVLMETPAIIYSIYMAKKHQQASVFASVKQAVTDGTQLLLIASLLIGFVTVSFTADTELLYGFIGGDIFTGALCFFLLSMGIKVGHALYDDLRSNLEWKLIALALALPWINGTLGYVAGTVFDLAPGDLFLTVMLMASSSYIVAPAILSKALPNGEVGKYLTMSIAVTFPMNILLGLPLWWEIIG